LAKAITGGSLGTVSLAEEFSSGAVGSATQLTGETLSSIGTNGFSATTGSPAGQQFQCFFVNAGLAGSPVGGNPEGKYEEVLTFTYVATF
jgi:hypothetical protein